jgi:hypothetical protein
MASESVAVATLLKPLRIEFDLVQVRQILVGAPIDSNK